MREGGREGGKEGRREKGREGGREGGCNFTTCKILHCVALYVLHVKQYFTISHYLRLHCF